MGSVLWIVNLGLLSYLVTLLSVRRRLTLAGETSWGGSFSRAFAVPPFLASFVYVLGWTCRILFLLGLADNSVVSSLALLAPLGAGLLIMQTPIGLTRRRYATLLGSLFVLEFAYAALIQSKTPVMAILLFGALGLGKRGWKVGRGALLLSLFSFLGLFYVLQQVKIDASSRADLAVVDQAYPAIVRPFLPVLRRFDLLSAATDAWAKPYRSWLGWDYFLRLFRGLAPWGTPPEWTPHGSPGLSWPAEVRASSLPGAGVDVSLADGFVAEGYAWLGVMGVILFGAAVALLTVVVARLLTQVNPVWSSVAVLLLYEPTLFERGLLGVAAAAGQDLQAALVFGLLWLLFGPVKGGTRNHDNHSAVEGASVQSQGPTTSKSSGAHAALELSNGPPPTSRRDADRRSTRYRLARGLVPPRRSV